MQYFFFTKICFVKGESRKTYRGGEHFGRRRTWNLVPYNSARRRFPNLPHVIPYLQRSHWRSPIREHEYAPVRSVAVNWPVMSVHRHPCLSGVSLYCTRTPVAVRPPWTWLMFARISLFRSKFSYEFSFSVRVFISLEFLFFGQSFHLQVNGTKVKNTDGPQLWSPTSHRVQFLASHLPPNPVPGIPPPRTPATRQDPFSTNPPTELETIFVDTGVLECS